MSVPRVGCVVTLSFCIVAVVHAQESFSVTDCQQMRLFRSGSKGDRLGYAVAGAGDVNGDGFVDVLVGAPFHDLGRVPNGLNNGAAYLLMGAKLAVLPSNELDLASLGQLGMLMVGAVGTQAGSALAGLGDINEDGFADVAVSTGHGYQATVVFGASTLPSMLQLNMRSLKSSILLNTGVSVAAAGDINGDGFLDALFGNPYAELMTIDGKENYLGKVTVLLGSVNIPRVVDANNPGEAGFTIRGPGGDLLGKSVCGVGDVNADGFDDFVLSAPRALGNHRGISYLILGSAKRSSPVKHQLVINNSGGNIARIGDLNDDGFDDFLVCSNDYRALIVWGSAGIGGRVDLNSEAPASVGTVCMGASVGAGAGDVNGDGLPDIVFGLPYRSPNKLPSAGQVVILFGNRKWPPIVDLLAPETPHVTIDGVVAHGGFGASVASIGDLEVDGYGDLIVGAPHDGQSADGEAREGGEAYILSGRRISQRLSKEMSATLSQSP